MVRQTGRFYNMIRRHSMILVPLFDLKFLKELAASTVGTSNRRHSSSVPNSRDRHSLDPDCWISFFSAASSSNGSMVTISVTPTLLDVEGKWSGVATRR